MDLIELITSTELYPKELQKYVDNLYYYSSGLKKVVRQLRFYVSQRKTSGLESAAKRAEKVQDLAQEAEEPDKSGAPYKAWEDFEYHPNGSLRKQM